LAALVIMTHPPSLLSRDSVMLPRAASEVHLETTPVALVTAFRTWGTADHVEHGQ
jgi:hypothetical protein